MYEGTSEGIQNGLTLVLWAENTVPGAAFNGSPHRLIPGIKGTFSTESALKGVRLIVTEPGQIVGPNYKGVDILPGVSTIVGLTAQRIHHLEYPYSNCSFTNQERNLLMHDINKIMGKNTPKQGSGLINSSYTQPMCRY